MSATPMLSAGSIKHRAVELGFDRCGIAPAEAWPELSFFREWIDRGCAGEMGYLARSADRRQDVRHVLPSARTVIVVAMIYNTDRPYSVERPDAREGLVSRYAWGDDYHDVMGRQLGHLLTWMRHQQPESFEARAYVDTGPIQERVYAQYAGLGWIGKNTCLINADLGSWLFLGEILCSLDLAFDQPALDQCGTCTLCLDSCPTRALVAPYELDATRCLSYLTIELKGAIPQQRRDDVGAHVYGCDICQEVCPYNAMPAQSSSVAWQPRRALDQWTLLELWRASDVEWRTLRRGSAMRRASVKGIRRNLAVALGNSHDSAALAALDEPRADESCEDPLVREHVAWAREKLRSETSGGDL